MNNKTLRYELTSEVVNYLLAVVNKTQIAGVQGAKDLLTVVELLQNPLNAEEIEKETYEALKGKFDKKEEKKK